MKVLDLRCVHDHRFEGWFDSEDDFQSQRARGLVSCPMCGDGAIEKCLSAPRLNLGATTHDHDAAAAASTAMTESKNTAAHLPQAVQAAWLQMAREVLAKTEDVGPRFADEARKIHHGDAPERGIRGQATPDEVQALAEEGIDAVPLPLPDALKHTLQ